MAPKKAAAGKEVAKKSKTGKPEVLVDATAEPVATEQAIILEAGLAEAPAPEAKAAEVSSAEQPADASEAAEPAAEDTEVAVELTAQEAAAPSDLLDSALADSSDTAAEPATEAVSTSAESAQALDPDAEPAETAAPPGAEDGAEPDVAPSAAADVSEQETLRPDPVEAAQQSASAEGQHDPADLDSSSAQGDQSTSTEAEELQPAALDCTHLRPGPHTPDASHAGSFISSRVHLAHTASLARLLCRPLNTSLAAAVKVTHERLAGPEASGEVQPQDVGKGQDWTALCAEEHDRGQQLRADLRPVLQQLHSVSVEDTAPAAQRPAGVSCQAEAARLLSSAARMREGAAMEAHMASSEPPAASTLTARVAADVPGQGQGEQVNRACPG